MPAGDASVPFLERLDDARIESQALRYLLDAEIFFLPLLPQYLADGLCKGAALRFGHGYRVPESFNSPASADSGNSFRSSIA